MFVAKMCARSIATCYRHASAAEIARQMRDAQLGEVIVVETRGDRICPVGIITEHDIVARVVAADADAARMTAADLLIEKLETVLESELVYDAIWHMRSKRVRHLAVVDAHDALIGVLRADDVSEFLASELIEVSRIGPHRAAEAEPAPSHVRQAA